MNVYHQSVSSPSSCESGCNVSAQFIRANVSTLTGDELLMSGNSSRNNSAGGETCLFNNSSELADGERVYASQGDTCAVSTCVVSLMCCSINSYIYLLLN